MNRRNFIKSIFFSFLGLNAVPGLICQDNVFAAGALTRSFDDHIRDYLHKMAHFNEPSPDDIYVEKSIYPVFESTVKRLRRLQKVAGHGNFQILSFEDGINIAKRYTEIGAFTKPELEFMERIFYEEARRYGFFGQKPLQNITSRINKKDVTKIPYTGNYLYKGKPLRTYEEVKDIIGDKLILTSGVRGVMKQFLLFLNKAYSREGNLSLASRSLAPPGYSFHGNGDFDVGQVGYGSLNFTSRFTKTDVYKRLSDLGYLKLRYPMQNMLGVRFEPWHIKVSS